MATIQNADRNNIHAVYLKNQTHVLQIAYEHLGMLHFI